MPLDTERVDSYLDAISFLSLGEYVTYNATDEELADCGRIILPNDSPFLRSRRATATLSFSFMW